ncbi:hypothetical protein WBP07_20795 (plasmid) [Novosphingobium sp. BL-8A]|uniref:hypothetical protein n=1 Tax=Novosphingobium sp. BL-8A TaxID=3127639 RepID=UPI0037583B75
MGDEIWRGTFLASFLPTLLLQGKALRAQYRQDWSEDQESIEASDRSGSGGASFPPQWNKSSPWVLGGWETWSDLMPKYTFETPDGEEVEINSINVVDLVEGRDDQVTVLELQDGNEIAVLATREEVVSYLDLDPLQYLSGEYSVDEIPEDFDESDYED